MTELEKALNYARDVGLTDHHVAAAVNHAADEARFAQQPTGVTLWHPDLDVQVDVHPDSVAQYQFAGWQVAQPPEPEPEIESEEGVPALVDVELPEEK